jgi:hypothetical protein
MRPLTETTEGLVLLGVEKAVGSAVPNRARAAEGPYLRRTLTNLNGSQVIDIQDELRSRPSMLLKAST